MMPPRDGMRGGRTRSLAEGQQRLAAYRPEESEAVRRGILVAAYHAPEHEFHATAIEDWNLAQPNVIGAQVNALARSGLLSKVHPMLGVTERRRGGSAAHGRESYVWWLTQAGYAEATRIVREREAQDGVQPTSPLPDEQEVDRERGQREAFDLAGSGEDLFPDRADEQGEGSGW